MDVRISGGDVALSASGNCEYIAGLEEAVQRVRISALTVKGSFIYDRELGTDYSGLGADDALLCEKLETRLKESCIDIRDVEVRVVSCDRETLVAVLKVNYQNEEMTTEVDLSGILQ